MESRYTPQDIEDKWYRLWEREGAFKPRAEGKPFTIVIPPPNVTGALHMGHALNNTLQDVLVRWKRMQGFRALYQPGTDHAGIATQSVVERELQKEGKRRQDLGREEFVKRVWAWKNEYGDRIVTQLKKLGCSCDWTRMRFTMDEGLSEAVTEVFVKLYEEGLIYQGTRLVNWDPTLLTAIADEEVETRDTPGRFYSLRYPLADDLGTMVVVSTTRPETLFGDVAVAVHPEDERYRDLIGRQLLLPTTGRSIPIIADEHADPEKGTGAVKITPAHDFNDYEVGQRHGLIPINVLNPDGTLNEKAAEYAGLDRFAARKKLMKDLEAQGLVEKVEDKVIPIPYCYRSGAVVEPYLMAQWYVKMRPLAEPALKAVADGDTRFVPARYVKTYNAWLEPFRDWCISRQLWWGHRIPAWHVVSETGGLRKEGTPVVVAKTDAEALQKAQSQYGPAAKIVRDEDVLDTWFSSGLWPFSTQGWPQATPDLETFYPTDILVTARDIIYFWVARMITFGLKFRGKTPFHTVYIHGTILDEKGQRMSKSKGNGIDPIEMVDRFGADAVRFALMTLTTEGQDIKLSPAKFEQGRNFANKLWNAVRFVQPHLAMRKGGADPLQGRDASSPSGLSGLKLEDRWILSRLHSTVKSVTEDLEALRFSDAAQALYRFTWDDLCSRYLEVRKRVITGEGSPEKELALSIFSAVLRDLIALLHPFMPFITEEIRESLGFPSLLITAPWPKAQQGFIDDGIEKRFEAAFAVADSVRQVRGQYALSPTLPLSVTVRCDEEATTSFLRDHAAIFLGLERIGEWKVETAGPASARIAKSAAVLIPGGKVYVALEGHLDLEGEKRKLEKELDKARGFVSMQEKKLSNEKFVQGAPPEVVELEREKLASQKDRAEKLAEALADLD